MTNSPTFTLGYVTNPEYNFDFHEWKGAEIKTKEQIEGMRKACSLVREIMKYTQTLIKVSIYHTSNLILQPGITTDQLDQQIHNAIIEK
jgi:methionine aminopeptidase